MRRGAAHETHTVNIIIHVIIITSLLLLVHHNFFTCGTARRGDYIKKYMLMFNNSQRSKKYKNFEKF